MEEEVVMGGECPNSDCKDRVQGHHTTLFGKDGMSGVVACIGKKLSRNTALVVLLAALSSVGGVTVYGLDAAKKDREGVIENKQDIKDVDAKLVYLEVMVEENHNNLEEIKTQIQQIHMTPVELKRLIKDAVEEGNNPG